MSTESRIGRVDQPTLVNSTIRVSVENRNDMVVVVKTYPKHRWQDAAAEARWLRSAADVEGVADLVHADRLSISTLHGGGTTLRSSPPAPADAAVLLAQVAATLVELEDLGLHHGAINPDHVVVGGGQTKLCSPHTPATEPEISTTGTNHTGTRDVDSDLQGLGRCCSYLLSEWNRQGVQIPRLEDWNGLRQRMGSGDQTLSASRVQAQLLSLADRGGRTQPRSRRRLPNRASKAAMLLVTIVAIAAGFWVHRRSSHPAGVFANGPQVVVDERLFQVGHRPGVAVALEPLCDGQPAVVLLDEDGSIWSFATAAPDTQGVREAEASGATELKVRIQNGCASISASGLGGEVQLQMFDP